ncbi:MAG: dihydroorotate dehydrogenase electron transfer subunit [Thermofilaceae archaeon]
MYICATVRNADLVCEDVVSYDLQLEKPLSSRPGQYIMLWVPRIGEIPLSVALEEGESVRLLVARKGRVTTYMHSNVAPGCRVFLRGPLGRGFTLEAGKALIVGGGVGVAPLLYLCKTLKERGARVTVAVGFRSAKCTPYIDSFSRYADELHIATEDGSLGARGTAVDLAAELIKRSAYDIVYTCGNEHMMRRVIELALKNDVRVEASVERLIKCGIGICGTCVLEPQGIRVCVEGPVLDGRTLAEVEDFGRWWRDSAGKRIPI